MPRPSIDALLYDRHRRRHGTTVVFRGRAYTVLTKIVAGNLTGSNTLPVTDLALSRSFSFSPLRFQPFTDEPAPRRDEVLFSHNEPFIIRQVGYTDSDPDDTVSIDVYAYAITRSNAATTTEGNPSMALTLPINRSATYGGVNVGGTSNLPGVSMIVPFSEAFDANTNNNQIDLPDIDLAQIVFVGIDCSGGNATIYTNNPSGSTPDDTYAITPSKPLWWESGNAAGAENPITADPWTGIYASVGDATGTDGKVTVKGLIALARI